MSKLNDNIKLTDYLGAHVGDLLAMVPFSGWKVTRSVEEDLPKKEVWYEFEDHGVEVICDEVERIRTIFLHRGDGEALAGITFSLSRREVLERYGVPSESGAAVRIPVLGDQGAWDRFTLPAAAIHVQYRLDCDEIDMITLICLDGVPRVEEQYLSALDDLAGDSPRHDYEITDSGESPSIQVIIYDEIPEADHSTGFTFGLSSVSHPEWVDGRPELMVSVRSKDHAWALCMGKIVRSYRGELAFSLGSILHFGQQISDESSMTSFLIFAPTLLDADEARIALDDRTVNLVQLYPMYKEEAPIAMEIGIEKFFWDLGIDFYDVKRPPVVKK